MNNALQTLFHPFESSMIGPPAGRALFLNARLHPALGLLSAHPPFLQQHFKPYADELQAAGYEVLPDVPAEELQGVSLALILLPQNMREARFLIAQGLKALENGGLIACAAANNAGGGRLKKLLQEFGLSDIAQDSRNKAKIAWAYVPHNIKRMASDLTDSAISAGTQQRILNGGFISRPGIFGWDKIDAGSALLAAYLPGDLAGTGADFGCGYGYLSDALLQKAANIETLYALDADHRALDCARDNLAGKGVDIHLRWLDLTRPEGVPQDLDFIVMNPPFHEGKLTDSSIGMGFIHTACSALKPSGRLFMVANAHLPYERILEDSFASVRTIFEEKGFKGFDARKG